MCYVEERSLEARIVLAENRKKWGQDIVRGKDIQKTRLKVLENTYLLGYSPTGALSRIKIL